MVAPQGNPRNSSAERASVAGSRPGIQPRRPRALAAGNTSQFASTRSDQSPAATRVITLSSEVFAPMPLLRPERFNEQNHHSNSRRASLHRHVLREEG